MDLEHKSSGDVPAASGMSLMAAFSDLFRGTQPLSNSPEEFATFIRNEKEKWSKVIRTANIKAE